MDGRVTTGPNKTRWQRCSFSFADLEEECFRAESKRQAFVLLCHLDTWFADLQGASAHRTHLCGKKNNSDVGETLQTAQ